MKTPLVPSLVIALLFLGAGCSPVPFRSTPLQPTPAPESAPTPEPAPEPAPEPTPEPISEPTSAPTSTSNATSTPAMATSTAAPLPALPKPSSTTTTSVTEPSSSALVFPGVLPAKDVNKKVRIKTTMGDIVIQVAQDQGPNAASNFVYLVKKKFYNGLIFHRVIPGFMIQGGDPTGTGSGGPGYQFQDDPVKSAYTDGIVAMANSGPNTNGSQFFILTSNTTLPPSYSIFGKVISGLDVAHKIADVDRDGNDRPNADVKMTSVKVE